MGSAVWGGAGGFGGRGAVSASGVLWGGVKGVSGLESGLLIWVLCLLSGGVWGGQGEGFNLVLRALGGVWSACGVWWGLVGAC